MKKLQKATLRIFLSCMVITAVLMLVAIWLPMQEVAKGPAPLMQYIITFFVIGLASFLIWAVTIILEIRDNIQKR
jgi:hypothetical protein